MLATRVLASTLLFTVAATAALANPDRTRADYIACVQTGLAEAGHYEGAIDADPGPGTQAALATYQAKLPESDWATELALLTRGSDIHAAATWCGHFELPWFNFASQPEAAVPFSPRHVFQAHQREKFFNLGPGGTGDLTSERERCPTAGPQPVSQLAYRLLDPNYSVFEVSEALLPYLRVTADTYTTFESVSCGAEIYVTVYTISFDEDLPVFNADDEVLFVVRNLYGDWTTTVRPWWTPMQLRRMGE